jgi:hypothetical protein
MLARPVPPGSVPNDREVHPVNDRPEPHGPLDGPGAGAPGDDTDPTQRTGDPTIRPRRRRGWLPALVITGVAAAVIVVAALVGTDGDDAPDAGTTDDSSGGAAAADATVAVTFGPGGMPTPASTDLTLRFLDADGTEIATRSWREVEERMAANPDDVTAAGGLLQGVPSGHLRLEATLRSGGGEGSGGGGGAEPASCTQDFRATRGDRLILRLGEGPLGAALGDSLSVATGSQSGLGPSVADPAQAGECAPTLPVAEWVRDRTGVTGEPYVGLPLGEAQRRAEDEGLTTRVVGVDGTDLAMTMDLQPDRLNLVLFDGVVVAAQLDGEPPVPEEAG